ncbi:hypothetical protein KY290_024475 [Solanum tuberosum]|uniref:Uncharacterized protein n=1 Tax=Solanum tuberosum TaxID=4113 RepID=A0ABQ7UQT6_SOLTU|nr:hypothetical protein KY290_024475 [Solanum tuberosum]
MKSGCMLDFVNTLCEDLNVHLGHGQIWWLEKGLQKLSKFLQDIEFTRAPLKEISFLQSLAIDAIVFIYSFDKDLLSLLHQKFNHFYAEGELIELLNHVCDATRIVPLKDLTDYARGELIFLRTFLMDSLQQCKQQTKITYFLTLIQSVTTQAQSDIRSLC